MAFAPLAIPIMMAVTAAVDAGGAVMQAKTASDQADTQAKIARQKALYARQAAAADEKEYRDSQSRNMATRRALLGASGIDPGSGSAQQLDHRLAAVPRTRRQRRGGRQSDAFPND